MFPTLCEQLNLGAPVAEPSPLIGGFLHRMVRLTTTNGDYAVKLLNPTIMARPTAHANFCAAEALERKLEQSHLPILPALSFDGKKMQKVKEQYCYLFPYYDGRALTNTEITPSHCETIGGLLAALHGVEYRDIPCQREATTRDWASLRRQVVSQPTLSAQLDGYWDILTEIEQRGNAALPHLPTGQTICHNDMDPKNVLWQGDACRIIDLECLSYDSPYLELLETALCWAGYESGAVDYLRLEAFLAGYAAAGGSLPTDWAVLYDANVGRLDWLCYNLERVLGDDPAQQIVGLSEVDKSITCLLGYHRHRTSTLTVLDKYRAV